MDTFPIVRREDDGRVRQVPDAGSWSSPTCTPWTPGTPRPWLPFRPGLGFQGLSIVRLNCDFSDSGTYMSGKSSESHNPMNHGSDNWTDNRRTPLTLAPSQSRRHLFTIGIAGHGRRPNPGPSNEGNCPKMSHFVPTTKKPGLLPCLDSPEGVRDGDTLFWGVRPVRTIPGAARFGD